MVIGTPESVSVPTLIDRPAVVPVYVSPAVHILRETDRFVEVELPRFQPRRGTEGRGRRLRTFADLGQDVAAHAKLRRTGHTLPSFRAESLLWHPFQLWQFARLHRLMTLTIATDMTLAGSEDYCRLVRD